MKIFIYKFTIIIIGFFILYEFTIGNTIKKFESKFYNYNYKERISIFKDRLREEIKKSNAKEKIFSDSDKILLREFINKVIQELKY